MGVLFCTLSPDHPLSKSLQTKLRLPVLNVTTRRFPDQESYIRCLGEPSGSDVTLFHSMHDPDPKLFQLLALAKTLKDLGAKSLKLVTPYLPYMRQDKRFNSGEAIASKIFAELISSHFSSLVTVDPHCHRYKKLEEIYTIPCTTLSAVEPIASYILSQVSVPVIIGPDEESEQWVSTVAKLANAPYVILKKERHGDRDIRMEFPELTQYSDCTPVLVDDIISTGISMIKTAEWLKRVNPHSLTGIGVHSLLSQAGYASMINEAGIHVVSTNSIPHESNAIDLSDLLSDALQ